jgi:hypothetical protein
VSGPNAFLTNFFSKNLEGSVKEIMGTYLLGYISVQKLQPEKAHSIKEQSQRDRGECATRVKCACFFFFFVVSDKVLTLSLSLSLALS